MADGIPARGFVELLRARVAFLTFLLALLYYALRAGLLTTIEAGIQSISTGIPVLKQLASALRASLDYVLHYIEARIAAAALVVEAPAVAFFQAATQVIEEGAYVTAHLAERGLHALDVLRKATIPLLIGAAVHPLWQARHALQVALRALSGDVAAAEAFAEREARALERKVAAAFSTAVAALDHSLALPWKKALDRAGREVRVAEGEIGRLWKLVRKGNVGLLSALAGVFVLSALRRFGLGWLRCGNVNRVGRSLCRFPVKLLEGLFADALDVLIVVDLCRIVRLMTDGAKLAAPALDALVAMVDDLIHCTGSERPTALPVAYYAPPTALASLPLA